MDTMDQLQKFISREIEKAMEPYKSKLEEIQNTLKTRPPHNIIVKKTSDLAAEIEDPVERRKYSRRLSAYLARLLKKDRKDWPPCIADLSRDGREYVVFFRFEEAEPKRKRKTYVDLVLESQGVDPLRTNQRRGTKRASS